MRLSIVKVRPAHPQEWDTIWENCEYATYFQSREWAELWCIDSQKMVRPDPKLVIFSDGSQALIPFSVHLEYGGLFKKYLLSFATTYGGWIAADPITSEHAHLLKNYILKKLCFNLTHTLIWRLNPYDDLAFKVNPVFSEEDDTHIINLTPGFDAIYKQSSRGHRSAEKKAKSQGVSVRIASSLADWKQYYEAYQSSVARWGDKCVGVLDWSALELMFDQKSANVKLWVSCYQNRVVSGALCVYSKNQVIYWHGASHEDYMHLRPATLLMYEIMKHSCEAGYSYFDFNPSAGLEGVRTFKERFGAESWRCPLIVITHGLKFKILVRNLLWRFGIQVGGDSLALWD